LLFFNTQESTLQVTTAQHFLRTVDLIDLGGHQRRAWGISYRRKR